MRPDIYLSNKVYIAYHNNSNKFTKGKLNKNGAINDEVIIWIIQ